jgi:acetyl esterase
LATPTTTLDPQVAALLERLQASAAPPPAPGHIPSPAEKIAGRRQRVDSFAAFGLAPEPLSRVEDLEIAGPVQKIPIRVYTPQTLSPAPLLVYYHGGGFVAGSLDSHDRLLRALANRARCRIVSVAYRLAPENVYPAANEDCWAALNWVAGHALEIGADPQRLAVAGDSAGGLLAAGVAQKAATHGLALRLQVLLYPNLDATMSKPAWRTLGPGAFLVERSQMIDLLDFYLPPGINRQDPDVSPLFAPNLTGLAPALIVTADHDPLHEEGEEYAARLQAANVAVELVRWPGMVHGFALFAGVLDAGRGLIDRTAAALSQAFR